MLGVLIKEGVCACSWWRREVEYQLKFWAIGRLVVSGDDNSDGGVHHVLDYMVFSLFFMKHDEITIVKRDTHDIYTITTLGDPPISPTLKLSCSKTFQKTNVLKSNENSGQFSLDRN